MEVIMIHSYKGGSGKTILSLNIAKQLAGMNKKVLLIEADLEGPVLSSNYPEIKTSFYINQYLKQPQDLEQYIVKSEPFDMIFASPEFDLDDILFPKDYESLLDEIVNIKAEMNSLDYDFVLIDLSPGVNYLAIASIILCDTVILALRPDRNSYNGTKLLIDQIYTNTVKKQSRDFHIVMNQIPDHPGFSDVMTEWKILFTHQFDFVTDIHQILFHPETSLHFLTQTVLLPDDDPLVKDIIPLCKTFIN